MYSITSGFIAYSLVFVSTSATHYKKRRGYHVHADCRTDCRCTTFSILLCSTTVAPRFLCACKYPPSPSLIIISTCTHCSSLVQAWKIRLLTISLILQSCLPLLSNSALGRLLPLSQTLIAEQEGLSGSIFDDASTFSSPNSSPSGNIVQFFKVLRMSGGAVAGGVVRCVMSVHLPYLYQMPPSQLDILLSSLADRNSMATFIRSQGYTYTRSGFCPRTFAVGCKYNELYTSVRQCCNMAPHMIVY